MPFRLPTLEEWQYAAKGGSKSLSFIYSGSNTPGDVAWYSGNSNETRHEVKQKQPNELGLYDMSGNVWEWVFHESLYYNYFPTECGGGYANDASHIQYTTTATDVRNDSSSPRVGIRLALTLK